MLERFISMLRVACVSHTIRGQHVLRADEPPLRYHHPLEDTLYEALRGPCRGLYVHWGVCDSGKSTAVRGAGLRLQEEAGRTVILLHGYDGMFTRSLRAWLRRGIGIPPGDEPISTYFRRPTTLVIDHFDPLLSDSTDASAYLSELAAECGRPCRGAPWNLLLVVSSASKAKRLRSDGCTLVGSPRRWTEPELRAMLATLPAVADKQREEALLQQAVFAGTPGALITGFCLDEPAWPTRIDFEWQYGMRLLGLA
jgi:hypothetical protein